MWSFAHSSTQLRNHRRCLNSASLLFLSLLRWCIMAECKGGHPQRPSIGMGAQSKMKINYDNMYMEIIMYYWHENRGGAPNDEEIMMILFYTTFRYRHSSSNFSACSHAASHDTDVMCLFPFFLRCAQPARGSDSSQGPAAAAAGGQERRGERLQSVWAALRWTVFACYQSGKHLWTQWVSHTEIV